MGAADFFIWLAIVASLVLLLVLFVLPVGLFAIYVVLCIAQDAWAEAGRHFGVGR